MKSIFYVCAILGVTSCQGLQTPSVSRTDFSLVQAEGIHAGEAKREEVLRRLGKPDRIIDLSQTDLKEQGEVWAYFAGGVQSAGRISLSFPANSDLVDSVSWDVRDGDPEQNLESALSRFKGATFVRRRPKYWSNPHSSPDEVFYEDSKTGLTITYLQTPKEVTVISWVQPNRTTASESDPIITAPFPYCIVGLCAGKPKQ